MWTEGNNTEVSRAADVIRLLITNIKKQIQRGHNGIGRTEKPALCGGNRQEGQRKTEADDC